MEIQLAFCLPFCLVFFCFFVLSAHIWFVEIASSLKFTHVCSYLAYRNHIQNYLKFHDRKIRNMIWKYVTRCKQTPWLHVLSGRNFVAQFNWKVVKIMNECLLQGEEGRGPADPTPLYLEFWSSVKKSHPPKERHPTKMIWHGH